ncbi:hypothetical protein JCM14036_02930 [Desulfotomaculum defluvii]
MTKHQLYLNAFFKEMEAVDIQDPNPASVKKLVFYGVKAVNTKKDQPTITTKVAETKFQFVNLIQGLIGLLKPSEFTNLFPISKDYSGQKYQIKDYFYTRDYLMSLPDEPIGDIEKVMEFLWEYHNWEVSEFVIHTLGCASDLRQMNGQPSIMEEFCAENEIKTYTMHTNQKGKKFLVDNETGKSLKVKRKVPRYLKLIK